MNNQPLPYIYDENNSSQTKILAQVRQFCAVSEDKNDKDLWKIIWQTIRRMSILTCWVNETSDTFITQQRQQTFKAKATNACCRSCSRCDDEDMIVIPLEFFPLKTMISGKITGVVGKRLLSVDISQEYLEEHTDHDTGKVYIMKDDFPSIMLYRGKCVDLCARKLTITLNYVAGYDEIPNGVLPAFCALMNLIIDQNKDKNACSNSTSQVSGLLKRKKVGNIEYEWDSKDKASQSIANLNAELHNLGVLGELSSITRCEVASIPEQIGEVV